MSPEDAPANSNTSRDGTGMGARSRWPSIFLVKVAESASHHLQSFAIKSRTTHVAFQAKRVAFWTGLTEWL